MRISIEKTLAATAVGGLDLVAEKYLTKYKVGPVNGADALRFAVAAGSYIVNYLGYETEFSEAAFYASLPGVIRAVANIVTGQQAAPQRVIVVEKTTTVSAPAPAPSLPVAPSEVPP